jgi:proteasome-associated ATPase
MAMDALKQGDLILMDGATGLALERVENQDGAEFRVESVPDMPLESVGGQDRALQGLITALTLALSDPKLAQRYGLATQRLILLVGPPGTGKTLMAKAAASHLQRGLGKRCTICVVKPGQFEDPYVGVTQRRMRECFKAVRSGGEMGILFLDELESVARARGNMVGFHSDKFLAALLAELQGFDTNAGANLAVIACTNKLSLLDPAIVERFECQIHVNRPNLAAARSIFAIHLPESLPFHPNGDQAAVTRRELIEHACTRFYSPNADNQIARVRFRDGTERVLSARDLASGRCFQQIAQAACQTAALRETQGKMPGVTLADIDEAVSDAIAKLSTLLTRENIHHYVPLPQDKDVIAVEPPVRRVTHPQRYLSVA